MPGLCDLDHAVDANIAMKNRRITERVHLLGAVDWSRRLFDALIPLPDGTSYNAYLVEGSSKTALIDSVDPAKAHILMEQLAGVKQIDYIVANHAEQDHSGTLPHVLAKYPHAVLLATAKGTEMLGDLLHIAPSRMNAVADGDTLSLGDRTLAFIHTPWVHWPETMSTYLQEDHILFSCDFFGSHYATTDLFVRDWTAVYEAAKRYYAEIMMPFRPAVRKNMEKIGALDIKLIAPSHGPLYDKPSSIIAAYQDWVSDTVKNEVVLPYVSMHGNTEKMAVHLTGALAGENVRVHLFDLSVADVGKLAIALVDAATMVVGAPTVHIGPHPAVVHATYLVNALRPKLRWASVINSYSWATKASEQIAALSPNLKVEMLPPVVCRGCPREKGYHDLNALAHAIAERHRGL